MKRVIQLSGASLGEAEKAAIAGVLDRGYLGMGADVRAFEEALTTFFGRPAVTVANGTAAVQLAVQAAGLGPGDEVLVPSLTYVATFQAVRATGATPVACDIEAGGCTLDVADAERRITPRTRAIMPVHYAGAVADMAAIGALAARHRLRIIEDAAHAFGTEVDGVKVGCLADIACFSFDGIKNITAGEGGCVVTEDAAVLQGVRDARLLGVAKDTEKRFAGERSWEFDVVAQGWRYHMSNVMAAIGLTQLQKFPAMAQVRRRLADRYDERLAGVAGVQPLRRVGGNGVPHIYVVRLPGLRDRRALQEQLRAAGIVTGVHYQPNHWLTLFRDPSAAPLPVVDTVYPELLTLPLHADLTTDDVDAVCDALLERVG